MADIANGTLEHCIVTNHKSIEYWFDAVIDPDGNGYTGSMPNTILMIISPNKTLPGPNGSTNGYWAVHEKDFSVSGCPSDMYEGFGMFFSDLGCSTDWWEWEVDPSTGDFIQTPNSIDYWPHNDNNLGIRTNLYYATNLAHEVNTGVDPNELIEGIGAWGYVDYSSCQYGDNIGQDWCFLYDLDNSLGPNNDGNNIPYVRVITPQGALTNPYGGDFPPQTGEWDQQQVQDFAPMTSWNQADRVEFDAKWDNNVAAVGFQNHYYLQTSYGSSDGVTNSSDYLNPPEDNKVYVWVRLKNELVMPPNDVDIKIDINGDARWIEVEPEGMPSNIHGSFDIISPTRNSGIETFTILDEFKLKTKTLDSQEASRERNIYSISGIFKLNKPTVVGTVKIESGDNKYLSYTPYIDSYSNLRGFDMSSSEFITLRRKRSSSNTSCEFDIMYTAKKHVVSTNGVSATLKHACREKVTRSTCLNNLVIKGSTALKSSGQTKFIKVYGKEGATVALSLNENIYDVEDQSHSETSVKNRVRQPMSDISILGHNANSTYEDERNITIPILNKTIGKSGYISFRQKFPSTTVKTTYLPAAYTNSSRITLGDASGVKVGDRVYTRKQSQDTINVVTAINVGGNENQIDVSNNLTTIANDAIFFKREREYSLNIIEDLSSPMCPTVTRRVTSDYTGIANDINYPSETSYTFRQYFDPTLTLKVVTSGLAYKINGGGMGVDYSASYVGIAGKSAGDLVNSGVVKLRNDNSGIKSQLSGPSIRIPLTISLTHATSNFTAVADPVFHYINATTGNRAWTKTFSNHESSIGKGFGAKNPSTRFETNVVSIGATGSDSLTIELLFNIVQWGYGDLTVQLDLDEILTMA